MSTEKLYIQAFNNGYVLAQYEPDFSNILTQNLTATNNYLQGFFEGKKQGELEKSKDQLSEIRQLRYQPQSKEKGFSRD